MSKFAAKHNPGITKLFHFEIPKDFEYKNFYQLDREYGIDNPFKVNAIYINTKGRYGDQPVIVTDNELVNAPHHLTENAKEIMSDAESVAMINDGVVGFFLYEYENKYGTHYSLEWCDFTD